LSSLRPFCSERARKLSPFSRDNRIKSARSFARYPYIYSARIENRSFLVIPFSFRAKLVVFIIVTGRITTKRIYTFVPITFRGLNERSRSFVLINTPSSVPIHPARVTRTKKINFRNGGAAREGFFQNGRLSCGRRSGESYATKRLIYRLAVVGYDRIERVTRSLCSCPVR